MSTFLSPYYLNRQHHNLLWLTKLLYPSVPYILHVFSYFSHYSSSSYLFLHFNHNLFLLFNITCTSPLFNSGHTQLYFKSRDFPNHQLLIFSNLTNLINLTNLSAPSSRSILPLYITSQNTCHIVSTTFFSYANYLLYLPTDSVFTLPYFLFGLLPKS